MAARGAGRCGAPGEPLPFPDATFDLVLSRHPVPPDWTEIARVLLDGGTYLAQHAGPASAFELIEYFLGPPPQHRTARDPDAKAARAAGLPVLDLRTAWCRMEFHDIGAVVYPGLRREVGSSRFVRDSATGLSPSACSGRR